MTVLETGPPRIQVPLSRPWFDRQEVEAAADVVSSEWLISGPRVAEFERRFAACLGASEAVAVNSGSSALLVALAALGVGPGDEVVVPDMTFVATASAALFLGACPVFADITLRHYGLDAEDAERLISPRTKVLIPVHYAGHTVDMDEIMALARRRGVRVLEDAAEAHLARYRRGPYAGTLGDVGIFSFTPSKPMTTGEGGMIVTADPDLAARCRRFRNFGDTGKFQWDSLGFNFRMPEIMGAIGLAQLGKLHEAVARRRAIAARYTEAFADEDAIVTPVSRTPEDGNFQLYTIRLQLDRLTTDRDGVMRALEAHGVASRLYYPALHRQPVFAGDGGRAAATRAPRTLEFERTALSLPIFPTLTPEEQAHVITTVRTILRERRR
ncbi:MAG TPA: DegT/DnrJ/EryC1/StrS family aminotransferase [Candidatus Binatia bacterium]|nr:DegT/DnrJ/EryC1/StrS family aminotransferase [Candidatus Binatia bacterium]